MTSTSHSGEELVKIRIYQPELFQSLEYAMAPEKLEVDIAGFAQQSGKANLPTQSSLVLSGSAGKNPPYQQATSRRRSLIYKVIEI